MKYMNNERAKFVYDELKAITTAKSEFRSLARSFPTMVHTNGLTAASAFLYAKKNKSPAHHIMYKLLSVQLLKDKDNDLMTTISNMESESLRLATVEIMSLLVWVKRFAEGMFEANE